MAAIVAVPARADLPAEGDTLRAPIVPCTCRFDGRDFQVGQSACIRGRWATCERVLNNTSWRIGETPCPVSSAGAESQETPRQ